MSRMVPILMMGFSAFIVFVLVDSWDMTSTFQRVVIGMVAMSAAVVSVWMWRSTTKRN